MAKTCKDCGEKYSDAANMCPHCAKPQKGFLRKWRGARKDKPSTKPAIAKAKPPITQPPVKPKPKPRQPPIEQLKLSCPMCEVNLDASYRPSESLEEYPYRHDCFLYSNTDCPFCQTTLALVIYKDTGSARLRDPSYDAKQQNYDEKYNEIETKISDLEDEIDEAEDIEIDPDVSEDERNAATKALPKMQQKLARLNKQMESLEDTYDKWDEKHEAKKLRWYEKNMNKNW